MPSGSIEVEAKFSAGPGTEARLTALGGTLAGSSSFRDHYYDTPDLRLTRADHWLRLRQGAGWELKCPPEPRGGAGHIPDPLSPEPPAEGAGGSSHVPDPLSPEPPAEGAGGSSHIPDPLSPEPPAEGAGGSSHIPDPQSPEPPAEGAGGSSHVPDPLSPEPPAEGAGGSSHVPDPLSPEPPAEGAGGSSHVPDPLSPEPPAEGAGGSSHVPAAPSPDPPAVATTYQELTSPSAIVGRLCGVLGVAPGPGWGQVPGAVAGLGLQEFASFVTRRRSYRLGGLRVDLDQADFGYAVAEVEAVVGAQVDVPAALEGVMQLRRALGQDGATRVPGKMSVYLQRHRPQHYQALLRAGVLPGDPQPPPHHDNASGPETPAKCGPSKGMGLAGAAEVERGHSAP